MKVYIIKVVGGKDETTTVIYRMSVRKHSKYASISKVLDGFFKKYPEYDDDCYRVSIYYSGMEG